MGGARTDDGQDWLVVYKKRIIIGIVAILTLTIVLTLFFIVCTMRQRLMEESRHRAEELGTVLHSSLSHLMEARDPDRMQRTLVAVGRGDTTILRAAIIDNRGRIAYSSNEREVGSVVDRAADPSCTGCHRGTEVTTHETTTTLTLHGEQALRYVHIIPNEPSCHACHPPSVRINGKLIIDRSLEPTRTLVGAIVVIISGLGVVCLAILIPFLWRILSRGVNTYIDEIRLRSAELGMLYNAVDRLSATIEFEALKRVIIEIISETLDADEVDMVLPSEYKDLGATVWSRMDGAIARKKVEQGAMLHTVIRRWLDGGLTELELDRSGREIVAPVSKAGNRVALIVVRSGETGFTAAQLPLLRAMANHIAVAFENATLYQMAITDELTGLYSNRHFRHTIIRKYAAFQEFGEKMTLLMADIDNFKRINDTYGHPAGDAILKDVGRCILNSIREDDLAFRYGGEEFAVILPATDIPAGEAVAERMRALIAHFPFKADQHVLTVTVSIGVSAWPASAENVKDLVMEADKALYEAKHTGKDRVKVRKKE